MSNDYYEILEISPNASSETIERVFHHLAMRYHPDNRESGDLQQFVLIVEAHGALKDPVKRAEYNIQRKDRLAGRENIAIELGDTRTIEQDNDIQAKILKALYVRLRQDLNNPGLSEFELENKGVCPREQLDFHIWYLKEKGWIRRSEDGKLTVTADGVDRTKTEVNRETTKLLRSRDQEG